MQRILVTGATGQIGSELIPALRQRYGADRVIAAGHKRKPESDLLDSGPYVVFDVRRRTALEEVVVRYKIDTIYHLAALLSATAEAQPERAWDININGLFNVLEVARVHGCALFHPSSIGAFGPSTPRDNTPQETIQRPTTIYGIAKVTGELLCDYYSSKFGVDTRGLRYPGLISYKTPPGGGTTDYAVEIFYSAIRDGRYTCFLDAATRLDMMFMPDAIRAAIELMEADASRLRHRNAYNLSAMSLTPVELGQAIKERIPGFVMSYEVDPLRQAIADSWPDRLDDSAARTEWGWQPEYDLEKMTTVMLAQLSVELNL
ncbi:MAG: L-threonine 3-dehydrogenase [Pseudomonadota bacterium]|nr:L-threonine 3-dehydrogenase [Pseudomonadota bacterium]